MNKMEGLMRMELIEEINKTKLFNFVYEDDATAVFVLRLEPENRFEISLAVHSRYPMSWFLSEKGTINYRHLKFEEVLQRINPEVAKNLIFHLDLFT